MIHPFSVQRAPIGATRGLTIPISMRRSTRSTRAVQPRSRRSSRCTIATCIAPRIRPS